MKTVSETLSAATTSRGLLRADSSRSITRAAVPADGSPVSRIFEWACRLTEDEVGQRLRHLHEHFALRGGTMDAAWQRTFTQVARRTQAQLQLSHQRQLYIGSLFSQEFPIENAGLLNPGLCLHADQSRLAPGSTRFVLVMDALGKDRTSSMVFREGVIDADYQLHLVAPGGQPCAPEPVANPVLRRSVIFRHLHELGFENPWTRTLMESLSDEFTRSELNAAIDTAAGATRAASRDSKASSECLRWIVRANYGISFDPESALSDRVLLPRDATGQGGLRAGRFTLLHDRDAPLYLATCTTCNGHRELPLLLESRDLVNFTVSLLGGGAARCHAMSFFPRKFAGRHAALCGRSDDAIYLMHSENPVVWEIAIPVKAPSEPWEALGIQPCGAPIETVAGWLVIYQGRGEMGQEAIGALLLDLHDPSKLRGSLKHPLLDQLSLKSGEAPPVSLNSMGAIIHRERLLIAYTVDEREIEIAQFDLDPLLALLVED